MINFKSHFMDSVPNLSFGEHWEEGFEVEHRVNTYVYWHKKIKREISRAITLRDRKSLSELVKYSVLLRDIHRETFFSSRSVTFLFSGVASLAPHENPFIELFNEYLSKLPNIPKTQSCKMILKSVCKKFNYQKMVQDLLFDITNRPAENFVIQNTSELRIAVSLLNDVDEHIPQKIKLFRVDPTIDFPIRTLIPYLEESDWVHFINRVDKFPLDLASWECLNDFIHTDLISDVTLDNIRNYVNGYWEKYHKSIKGSPEVEALKDNIFQYLFVDTVH